jgi:hypothetical protein
MVTWWRSVVYIYCTAETGTVIYCSSQLSSSCLGRRYCSSSGKPVQAVHHSTTPSSAGQDAVLCQSSSLRLIGLIVAAPFFLYKMSCVQENLGTKNAASKFDHTVSMKFVHAYSHIQYILDKNTESWAFWKDSLNGQRRYFKILMNTGIDSTSLYNLAGRYDKITLFLLGS